MPYDIIIVVGIVVAALAPIMIRRAALRPSDDEIAIINKLAVYNRLKRLPLS